MAPARIQSVLLSSDLSASRLVRDRSVIRSEGEEAPRLCELPTRDSGINSVFSCVE